jgi:hypothetical protein
MGERIYTPLSSIPLKKEEETEMSTSSQNIPCTTKFSFSITLGGKTYQIPDDQLVQQRDSKSCWGGVVSWGKDTLPADEGLVVLGTPFMSTVYS